MAYTWCLSRGIHARHSVPISPIDRMTYLSSSSISIMWSIAEVSPSPANNAERKAATNAVQASSASAFQIESI